MKDTDKNKPVCSDVYCSVEEAVFQALSSKGHVFPQSEEDVRAAEESLKEMGANLPAELEDSKQAWNRVKHRLDERKKNIIPLVPKNTQTVASDLARAARKGAEIPPEILEQMRRDRKKAEGELDDSTDLT